ncbi:MAG TPA: hypothetical protein VFC86_00560 [Planctomycetota bacterium]|nr:hypothetical protein [Planctomycetota bacterium]
MRGTTAVILATPVALGILALFMRSDARPVPTTAVVSVAKVDAPASGPAAPSLEKELERRRRAIEERERALERALADFENRMDQLIESIDWTRAESRVRFPIEYELIEAELAQVLAGLDDR